MFSTGVVLTLVIPAVSSGTGAGTLKCPLVPMGSAHGHTGHVRFLTSIEIPEGFDMSFPAATPDSTGVYCFSENIYVFSMTMSGAAGETEAVCATEI